MLKQVVIVFILCTSAGGAILPFQSSMPTTSTEFDSALIKTWQGIKKRSIDAYTIPLVHRPKSEVPHDAVSEGVGYGLLCALYCDDQLYFNKIWNAAEHYMWSSGGYYNWRVDRDGQSSGTNWTGPATDADEDIALALVFAHSLVKRGHWQPFTSEKGATYETRARVLIASIWNLMVEQGRYVKPGNWGGKDLLNPSYFAPAFYRIFAQFDSTAGRDWNGCIDQCYATLNGSSGSARGLFPDWCAASGAVLNQGPGYNAYLNGQALYKDAIRIYWRLATDYLWFGEPRARALCVKAITFVGTPAKANFYTLVGGAVPDSFTLGNNLKRPRAEHSHLTAGMWACAAAGADNGQVAAFAAGLKTFYTPGADFWGKSVDALGEDTAHNEMYFDQFLAWFGGAIAGGVFTNLYRDLNDPDPLTPLQWKKPPAASTTIVDASIAPCIITASFSKSASWTVRMTAENGIGGFTHSGSGDSVHVQWNGLDNNGLAMTAGRYTLSVSAGALQKNIAGIWLGRAINLRTADTVLIDDCADDDVRPLRGSYSSYLDSCDGKGGASQVTVFGISTGADRRFLRWSSTLQQGNLGFDPYAALQWSPPQSATLDGCDGIVITIRSNAVAGISVQLITSDITDYNYFSDSLRLTSQWNSYVLPLAAFKQRWGGGSVLDKSKITAIRFQFQRPSGSVCTIDVGRFGLYGTLQNFYTIPPPFTPLSAISHKAPRYPDKKWSSASTMVFDLRGRKVAAAVSNTGRGIWRRIASSNNYWILLIR